MRDRLQRKRMHTFMVVLQRKPVLHISLVGCSWAPGSGDAVILLGSEGSVSLAQRTEQQFVGMVVFRDHSTTFTAPSAQRLSSKPALARESLSDG